MLRGLTKEFHKKTDFCLHCWRSIKSC
jgi:hypothetical protein